MERNTPFSGGGNTGDARSSSADPFLERAKKDVRKRAKRMPKGITPPVTDPFTAAVPGNSSDYFNPFTRRPPQPTFAPQLKRQIEAPVEVASDLASIEADAVEEVVAEAAFVPPLVFSDAPMLPEAASLAADEPVGVSEFQSELAPEVETEAAGVAGFGLDLDADASAAKPDLSEAPSMPLSGPPSGGGERARDPSEFWGDTKAFSATLASSAVGAGMQMREGAMDAEPKETDWSELPTPASGGSITSAVAAGGVSQRAAADTPTPDAPADGVPSGDAPSQDTPTEDTTSEGAAVPPSAPSGPATSDRAAAYYGGGGSGEGGGSGGGGDDDRNAVVPVAMKPHADSMQDDIASGLLTLLFLLLLGWLGFNTWFANDVRDAPRDDRLLSPQALDLESEPAPEFAGDPFGEDPVDLRPTSPLPESAEMEEVDPTDLEAVFSPAPLDVARVDIPEVVADAPEAEVAPAIAPSCQPGRFARTYFCTAKMDMTPMMREALVNDLADWSSCLAGQELVVSGFADTRGEVAKNAGLAEGRAASVASLLREKGLSVVEVSGVGELADLEDERNCANQRRVDVWVKGETPPVSRACAPPAEMAKLICG